MKVNVEIGAHTYYQEGVQFVGFLPEEKIIIGKYCSIAAGVVIFVGANHSTERVSTFPFDHRFLRVYSNPSSSYKTTRNTEIGNDVWLGNGAFVAGGARIGHGAVIGARAAVFGDIPPYAIAFGNPARVMRFRFSKAIVEGLLRVAWWNWPDDVVRGNMEWFSRPVAEFVEHFDRSGETSNGRPDFSADA